MAMATAPALDDLPGFRRRFIVTPGPGRVLSAVEDDYHCMRVTIDHEGGIATAVTGEMLRAPWSTCPGAEARVRETFTGVALADFAARGEKQTNCTHLHDLATLAAAHADAAQPIVFDILVSDPVDGLSRAELRRDGELRIAWTIAGFRMVEPARFAGVTLDKIRPLLEGIDPQAQEEVKLLRWGVMIASGRSIPLAQQSDATRMPPNCFTFQPETAAKARRIGRIRDFTKEGMTPLDGAVQTDL